MDGYEVASHLRATERLSGLRLVAVTGYGRASDRLRSEESGFDAHLVEPVDFGLLALLSDQLFVSPAAQG